MRIWLVGSTNVGKSTLFNRLIWQFRAIVTDIPGTTVDILRHRADIDWLGRVLFADSPGLQTFEEERDFIKQIIDESDLIIFVIDDVVWITAKEEQITKYIMNSKKKDNVIVVVNKLDVKWKEREQLLALSDYYSLGFESLVWISAKTSRHMDDLQEMVYKKAKKLWLIDKEDEEKSDLPVIDKNSLPIAILGKPNAGKSTLLNTLVGKNLSKVENIPWTTRDYVVGDFKNGKQKFTVYDTAGIKKKWHMRGIESIAYQKTLDMLKYVRPIVAFVVDGTVGVSHRDMTLLSEIYNLALPMILVMNKSDLVNKRAQDTILAQAQAAINFAPYIPILNMSAKDGTGIDDLLRMANLIHKENYKRIETSEINKIIWAEFISRPPRFPKNKICKILYITQIDVNAPTFIAFVNKKDRANFAFKRWIENVIRKTWGFVWIPLVIRFKNRDEWSEESKAKRAVRTERIRTTGKTGRARKIAKFESRIWPKRVSK